jgi:Family of unknown function (DUF6498)
MLKRKLTRTDIYLIAANLLPVYGVWVLGWNAIEVFIVYAMETLIVGMLTVLKLSIASVSGNKSNDWYVGDKKVKQPGILFILFFIVHYGIFAAVQTSIFSESANINPPGSGLLYFFFHWYNFINKDIAIMLSGFIISYLARSFLPFIVNREYKTTSMMRLMFEPYGRIFIQQLTVLLGSLFLVLGGGKVFVLIFALVKTFVDVYINYDKILNKTIESEETKKGEK